MLLYFLIDVSQSLLLRFSLKVIFFPEERIDSFLQTCSSSPIYVELFGKPLNEGIDGDDQALLLFSVFFPELFLSS